MSQIQTHDNERFTINIFRYKFSDEFMELLFQFSKMHQYDDRKVFKESWKTWTEEQEMHVNKEIKRLDELNYPGDKLDKMFKSARYYFRKKSTTEKEPKERKKYTKIQKNLLQAMDTHINANIRDKPSYGFLQFCEKNKELIKAEIIQMLKEKMTDESIQEKLKKTFKNRYYTCISKKDK